MPRPPILPLLDWPALFESGQDFETWLGKGEKEENRVKMREDAASLALAPHDEARLAALPRVVHVASIAEDWCGDVVRHVPVLARLEAAAPDLHVRHFARAQSPEMFARHLTNGGEAIPKFIFLSDRFVECGNWGPMPDACREVIARGRACGDLKSARERVSAMYAADPGRTEVIREIMALIDIACCAKP